MGKEAKSVIVASLCLDNGCMRLSHSCYIQKKAGKNSDAISKCVFMDVIKVRMLLDKPFYLDLF